MDTVESVVQTTTAATESVQRGLRGLCVDVEVVQNEQEQFLDRLETVAIQVEALVPAIPLGSDGVTAERQNEGAAPILSMTLDAPPSLGHACSRVECKLVSPLANWWVGCFGTTVAGDGLASRSTLNFRETYTFWT